MTVLSACQSAIMRLVGEKPPAVVSSQDTMNVEIVALAQEAAVDIMKSHDWQALTEFYTITGDGEATSFPFPEDYDRQAQATGLYDPDNWAWGYTHVTDYGEWIRYQDGLDGIITPGVWTIRKNQFHFLPTPGPSTRATFVYISNYIFTGQNGSPKKEITRDDDQFVLDDRLLTLALIWRWKELKEMDYGEDMRNYDIALSQAMARDKGSRVIRRNQSPIDRLNPVPAWPWGLGPGNY